MDQPGTSSGAIAVTTGAQTITGPGILLNASLIGGTTANVFTIYDGTSTSGIMLANIQNTTAGVSSQEHYQGGIVFNTGLYVVVSGTGSKGLLTYRLN